MPENGNYKLELDELEYVIKTELETTREQKMSWSQMAGQAAGQTCWNCVGEDSGVSLGVEVFNPEAAKES